MDLVLLHDVDVLLFKDVYIFLLYIEIASSEGEGARGLGQLVWNAVGKLPGVHYQLSPVLVLRFDVNLGMCEVSQQDPGPVWSTD
jgi:hypothetical protein